MATVNVAGLMVIPTITAELTDRLAGSEVIPARDAVTVVLPPTVRPLATPALLIVAIAVLPVAQFTWFVISALFASV